LAAVGFICACGFAADLGVDELVVAAGAGVASVIAATSVSASAVATAVAPGVRTSVACLLVVCGRCAVLWRRAADFFAMCVSSIRRRENVSVKQGIICTSLFQSSIAYWKGGRKNA
jgi:hypothetical protein